MAHSASRHSTQPAGTGPWPAGLRGHRISGILGLVLILFPSALNSLGATPPGDSRIWRAHIQPLFSKHCFKCHGELKQKGGLDLRTIGAALTGGDNGPALVPGHPKKSMVFEYVLPGAETHMPPKDYQLTDDEIGLVKMWITGFDPAQAKAHLEGRDGEGTAAWNSSNTSLIRPHDQELEQAPPENLSPSDVIDYYITQGWQNAGVTGNSLTSDASFIRRIYLDLAGRIPTTEEQQAFLSQRGSRKRAALIDRLLDSPEYARRMREVFDVVFMNRPKAKARQQRQSKKWYAYLETAFAENRPWDVMTRDLLLARPKDAKDGPAVWFQYERKNNHQSIIEAVSPAFFGVQIQCAQCHNHPLAPEIKQAHYWGMVAFFNRSKNADTPEGPAVSESAIGGFVSFANLKKESQPALLTFFDDHTIKEQRPGKDEKEKDSPDNYLPVVKDSKQPKVPKFSRRSEFTDWAATGNPLLSRALVNRLWALFMGRGLVHPVDKMDSAHPPSHPNLLAWLAQDFEQSGYDIRRLVRILVLSRTYQLQSAGSGKTKDPAPLPEPALFTRALEKPLTAESLYRSLLVATGNGPAPDGTFPGWEEHWETLTTLFPEVFPVEYQANLRQALFLANHPVMETMLEPRDNNLVARLSQGSGPREKIQKSFEHVLGRTCTEEEMERALAFFGSRLPDQDKALGQLLWALLTSAEFIFNH